MKSYLNILAQADTTAISLRTMAGIDYTVVPVVALVEGVLQGAAAAKPELALASEFGKVVEGWNGRPLVLNHPQVNGQFVSANSPEVLEQYCFGWVFNARIEDAKLKVDAWIDNGRVAELGGEFQEVLDRINAGELVEVSTGLFTDILDQKGKFQGESYFGIWVNVVPDHLAVLSEGAIGACSVADGCGLPRLNLEEITDDGRISMLGLRFNKSRTNKSTSGGSPAPDNGPGATEADPSPQVTVNEQTCSCQLQPEVATVLSAFEDRLQHITDQGPELLANSFPSNMPDVNVRRLLTVALHNKLKEKSSSDGLYFIHMFTSDVVVYESYNSSKVMQIAFNIGTDMKVSFSGEPQEVAILSQVVPVTNSADSTEGDDEEEETEMSTQAASTEANNAATTNVQTQNTPVTATEVKAETQAVTPAVNAAADSTVVNSPADQTSTKKLTVQEYIDQAPDEIKEVLAEGVAKQNAHRDALIKGIAANKEAGLTEDELKQMKTNMLEKIAKGMTKPAFFGAAPNPTIRDQASDNSPPPAPKAFPVKAA